MNVPERVAALEALLARVQKNAQSPRAGGARTPAPPATAAPVAAQRPAAAAAPPMSLPDTPKLATGHAPAAARAAAAFEAPARAPDGAPAHAAERPAVAKGDTDRSPIELSEALKLVEREQRPPAVEVRDAKALAADTRPAPPARASAPTAGAKPAASPPAPKVEPKVEPTPAPRPVEPPPVEAKAPVQRAPLAAPTAGHAPAPPPAPAEAAKPPAAPAVDPRAMPPARRAAAKTLVGGLSAADLKAITEASNAAAATPNTTRSADATPAAPTPAAKPATASVALEEALMAATITAETVVAGGEAAPVSPGPAGAPATQPEPAAARRAAPPPLPPEDATAKPDPLGLTWPREPVEEDEEKQITRVVPEMAGAQRVQLPSLEYDAELAPEETKPAAAELSSEPKVAIAPAAAKAEPPAAPRERAPEPAPKPAPVAATPPVSAPPAAGSFPRWVAFLIAAALAGGGAFYVLQSGLLDGGPGPEPTAPKPTVAPSVAATTPAPPPPSVAPAPTVAVTAVPSASAAPAASATPSATPAAPTASAEATAPAPTASAAAPPAGGDGSELPPSEGYLMVTFPATGNVFLNGKFAGRVGEKLKVPCGKPVHVSVARAGDPPVAAGFYGRGNSKIAECRKVTDVKLTLGPAPGAPPGGGGDPY